MVVMNPSGDIAKQQAQLVVTSTLLMLLIIVPVIVLTLLFAWRYRKSNTKARYEPGRLVGAFLLFYGLFRFAVEFIREPDAQLVEFARATGLHMGQWLCIPMILAGAWLMLSAKGRRQRVEPIAGTESVA